MARRFFSRVAKTNSKLSSVLTPIDLAFVYENENAPSSRGQPRGIFTPAESDKTRGVKSVGGGVVPGRVTAHDAVNKQWLAESPGNEHNLKHVTWPPARISWLETSGDRSQLTWRLIVAEPAVLDVNEELEISGLNNYKEKDIKTVNHLKVDILSILTPRTCS